MSTKIYINETVVLDKTADTCCEIQDKFKSIGLNKASILAKKQTEIVSQLLEDRFDLKRVGLIVVSQFPNMANIVRFSQLIQKEKMVSAQLFPYATLISTTAAISIACGIKGMSYTINQGIVGVYQAFKIADLYLKNKVLDAIIIAAGDEYIEETIASIELIEGQYGEYTDKIGAILISSSPTAYQNHLYSIEACSVTESLAQKESKKIYNMETYYGVVEPIIRLHEIISCGEELECVISNTKQNRKYSIAIRKVI